MTKIVTFGVFDYFHYGHLRLFENAKKLGDYLIVAIQTEDTILKYKPDTRILYSLEQRMEIIKALRIVDQVVTYSDVDKTIKQIDFDVFAIGGDQNHSGFLRAVRWCEENGKKIIRLERTPFISSSSLKKELLK